MPLRMQSVAADGGRRHAGPCRPLRSRRIRRRAGAGGAAAARRGARSMPGLPRSPTRSPCMRRRRSRSSFDWPDAVRVDGGLVGGGRLAWPPGADEERAAGLARVRRHDPHRRDGRGGAGAAAARHRRSRTRASTISAPARWSRASRAISWSRSITGRRVDSARSPRAISPRLAPESGRAPRHRRERRSPGAAHGQSRRRAPLARTRARRAVVARSGDRRPARGEVAPHHQARSVRHLRVRARGRARRMGGLGRVHVLETPIRMRLKASRARPFAVDFSACRRSDGRRWCRSLRRAKRTASPRSRRSRSSCTSDLGAPDLAAARAAAEEEVAFAASLCDHPQDTLIAVRRTFEDGAIREAFRTLRPRGDAQADAGVLVPGSRGRGGAAGETIDLVKSRPRETKGRVRATPPSHWRPGSPCPTSPLGADALGKFLRRTHDREDEARCEEFFPELRDR